MKHLIFPTVAQADAFVQDLQSQGVIRPEMGNRSVNRQNSDTGSDTISTDSANTVVMEGGTAEDAGAGAVKGTGVGLVAGAVAGVVATAATVATGGLALPVILGMAALGSGVGASVGAIGGAAGVDETDDYTVSSDNYDRMSQTMNTGGRAIAVEDSVPTDVVQAAATRHGGQLV